MTTLLISSSSLLLLLFLSAGCGWSLTLDFFSNLTALVIMSFYGILSGLSAILLKKGIFKIGGLNIKKFHKDIPVIAIKLIKTDIWLLGALLSLIGFGIYFISLSFFELSIIKPLVNTNLLFTFLFAAIFFHEKLRKSEWLGVLILLGGLLLIGFSPTGSGDSEIGQLAILYLILPFTLILVFLLIILVNLVKVSHPEFVYPLFAGLFFGLGTICTKGIVVGLQLSDQDPLLVIYSVLMYLTNYFFAIVAQMMAFEKGRLSIVSPITNSLSIISSIIGALLIFGEQLIIPVNGIITFISYFKILGIICLSASLFLLRREIIKANTVTNE